jgi:hypothetical protein
MGSQNMKRVGTLVGFIVFLVCVLPFRAIAQSPISEQKEVVAFIFGTVHPVGSDKKPMTDKTGKPVVLDMPLGTGFFVGFPDARGGPDYTFVYFVTAKHVLRDFDGSFLRTVKLRVNLKTTVGSSQVDFTEDIPVSDENGKLLWFHGKNESDEAVAFPLLLNQAKAEFKVIPITMFVDDTALKSDDVEEGDNIYFIGLLAQYYGAKRNHPVVRRGTLALMTDEEIPTLSGPQKVFIAELQSWPGNSGSPVFLNLGGLRRNTLSVGQNLKFLGILLGAFLNKIPASVIGGPQVVLGGEDAANIGVSLIVPATSLRDVLDSTEAQRNRDAQIQKLPKQP